MASKFPCSNPPSTCDQQPNPITTYSAEGDDSTTFIAEAWQKDPPLLNKAFTVYPCAAFAESQDSQSAADLAAANAALVCGNPCSPTFTNSAQTATSTCPNGLVCSFTYPAGQFTALDQLSADRLAFTAATKIVLANPVCPTTLRGGMMCLGAFFSAEVFVSGVGPFTFEKISGSLPPGVVMVENGNSVSFSGVPETTGVYTFTLQITNTAGVVSLQNCIINVVHITTSSPLPDGSLGSPYSTTLDLVDANTEPVTWSIVAGALPDGLSLNSSTGEISGTPTTVGSSDFTVQVSDSTGTCDKDFSINVASSSNICTDGIGALALNRYGVDGYFDGMIPNPSDPSFKPPWDGTFPFYMDGDGGGPNPGIIGFAAGGPGINGISIAGNKACSVLLLFNGCIDGVPQWELRVEDINGDAIWDGTKIDGQTPEGVFNLVGGFDAAPLTLTIVLVDETAVPMDHGTSCVT
jgi:putative Ig domain-containing protein